MKSQKTKQKALELYINNISTEKIAKEVNVSRDSIEKWVKKFGWKEIREKSIQKSAEKSTDKFSKIIDNQLEIGHLAQEELKRRLKEDSINIKDPDLIRIMSHNLEVVRPKSQNFNFTKNETNVNLELAKMLNATREGEGL